jgi:hypothetical protein
MVSFWVMVRAAFMQGSGFDTGEPGRGQRETHGGADGKEMNESSRSPG